MFEPGSCSNIVIKIAIVSTHQNTNERVNWHPQQGKVKLSQIVTNMAKSILLISNGMINYANEIWTATECTSVNWRNEKTTDS
eukprot:scaffold104645_cov53-Attheya_sp.AAC.2